MNYPLLFTCHVHSCVSNTIDLCISSLEPVLGFTASHVYASEPSSADEESYAKVTVHRTGDLSRVSIVTVYTKEGSAKSGTDYIDKTQGW